MKVEIKCIGSRTASLSEMKPLQGDLKDLSEENYQKLKTEILDLGFSAPFFCWSLIDGKSRDSLDLLDGHQRHKTILRMESEGIGMPESFPIVDVDAKNYIEAKKKVLAISSNYGTITNDGLKEFIIDIDLDMAEIKDSFTFDAIDFGEVEIEEIEAREDDDNVPELKEDPITRRGDIWLLGNHRVMCGDSTMIDDVEKLMDGEKADMVFTDPPYNVAFNGRSGKHDVIKNDDLSVEDFNSFIRDVCQTIKMLNPDSYYVWCNWKFYGILQEELEYKSCIVWAKNNFGIGNNYRHQHEFCIFSGDIDSHIKNESDLWAIAKDSKYIHPTQKPVALSVRAFGNHVKQLNIVDLFGGSGSTLIGAEKTSRNAFVMELDEKYCDVIIKRWQDYTKKEATLESTGETYNSL